MLGKQIRCIALVIHRDIKPGNLLIGQDNRLLQATAKDFKETTFSCC
jgi:serine/threonine protein kinase